MWHTIGLTCGHLKKIKKIKKSRKPRSDTWHATRLARVDLRKFKKKT